MRHECTLHAHGRKKKINLDEHGGENTLGIEGIMFEDFFVNSVLAANQAGCCACGVRLHGGVTVSQSASLLVLSD